MQRIKPYHIFRLFISYLNHTTYSFRSHINKSKCYNIPINAYILHNNVPACIIIILMNVGYYLLPPFT